MIRELEEVDGSQTPTAQQVSRDDAVGNGALVLVELVDFKLKENK